MTVVQIPVVCPFRLCTGYACPGCGMVRSVAAVARGDFELAWRYHPYVYALVIQAFVLAVIGVRNEPQRLRGIGVRLGVANLGALVVLWLVRWRIGLLDFVVSS